MNRRPALRVDKPRPLRHGDLQALRPETWPPVLPGQQLTLFVGYGLSTDAAEVIDLARRLRPAYAIRIVGRTETAGRTARAMLSTMWRSDDAVVSHGG
jgi:hypothetical protein